MNRTLSALALLTGGRSATRTRQAARDDLRNRASNQWGRFLVPDGYFPRS